MPSLLNKPLAFLIDNVIIKKLILNNFMRKALVAFLYY